MKLIYIDEAGNTGRAVDPDQPLHMLGALIIDEANVRAAEASVLQVTNHFFPKAVLDGPIELHGHHIRSGKGAFKALAPTVRIELVTELLRIPALHSVRFGWVAIRKAEALRRTAKHPHELAFMFLVERIQDILTREEKLGMLIADEQHEIEEQLIMNLDHYKQYKTNWGYRPTPITNIIDSIHFVKSRNNRLIQLADVLTFIQLRKERTHATLWERYCDAGTLENWSMWLDREATVGQKQDLALANMLPSACFAKIYP